MEEIEYVGHRLARETMTWNETIPEFNTRFPGILESCIKSPFQTFSRRELYKGLEGKAAVLLYFMIKNHPFRNGNKRIAMTTLFYFLYKNNRWLRVDTHELYNFTKWVTESNPKLKDETIAAAKKFISTYIIDIS